MPFAVNWLLLVVVCCLLLLFVVCCSLLCQVVCCVDLFGVSCQMCAVRCLLSVV